MHGSKDFSFHSRVSKVLEVIRHSSVHALRVVTHLLDLETFASIHSDISLHLPPTKGLIALQHHQHTKLNMPPVSNSKSRVQQLLTGYNMNVRGD